jgi:hypothetical protein
VRILRHIPTEVDVLKMAGFIVPGQGEWPFSYVGFQSIGRIRSPNACNFSSARLAYTRTLAASSASAWMR